MSSFRSVASDRYGPSVSTQRPLDDPSRPRLQASRQSRFDWRENGNPTTSDPLADEQTRWGPPSSQMAVNPSSSAQLRSRDPWETQSSELLSKPIATSHSLLSRPTLPHLGPNSDYYPQKPWSQTPRPQMEVTPQPTQLPPEPSVATDQVTQRTPPQSLRNFREPGKGPEGNTASLILTWVTILLFVAVVVMWGLGLLSPDTSRLPAPIPPMTKSSQNFSEPPVSTPQTPDTEPMVHEPDKSREAGSVESSPSNQHSPTMLTGTPPAADPMLLVSYPELKQMFIGGTELLEAHKMHLKESSFQLAELLAHSDKLSLRTHELFDKFLSMTPQLIAQQSKQQEPQSPKKEANKKVYNGRKSRNNTLTLLVWIFAIFTLLLTTCCCTAMVCATINTNYGKRCLSAVGEFLRNKHLTPTPESEGNRKLSGKLSQEEIRLDTSWTTRSPTIKLSVVLHTYLSLASSRRPRADFSGSSSCSTLHKSTECTTTPLVVQLINEFSWVKPDPKLNSESKLTVEVTEQRTLPSRRAIDMPPKCPVCGWSLAKSKNFSGKEGPGVIDFINQYGLPAKAMPGIDNDSADGKLPNGSKVEVPPGSTMVPTDRPPRAVSSIIIKGWEQDGPAVCFTVNSPQPTSDELFPNTVELTSKGDAKISSTITKLATKIQKRQSRKSNGNGRQQEPGDKPRLISDSMTGGEPRNDPQNLQPAQDLVTGTEGVPIAGLQQPGDPAPNISEDTPFRVLSLNQNGKNVLHEHRFHAIALQESQFQSSHGMPDGYLSCHGKLKLWTRFPHLCILKNDFCVAVVTVFQSKEVIIINLHLSHDALLRRPQLKKLKNVIDHLRLLDKDANQIVIGDYNETRNNLRLGLSMVINDEPTWIRPNNPQQCSCIDHAACSQHLTGTLKLDSGPGDHKKLEAEFLGFRKTKPRKMLVELQHLSKTLTDALEWRSLDKYPTLNLLRGYNGSPTRGARSEEEFQRIRIEKNRSTRESQLKTRAEWRVAASMIRWKPISTSAPLTDKLGNPITDVHQLGRVTIAALEEATNTKYHKVNPKGIDFSLFEPTYISNLIDEVIRMGKVCINPTKAGGEDGISTAGLKKFLGDAPSNTTALIKDSLQRPNALSARVTLIQKKDLSFRPIQIANQPRTVLEKVILKRLNLPQYMQNDPDIYGFRTGCSTHLAIKRLRAILTRISSARVRSPVLFLDLKKAYNTVNLEPLLEEIRARRNGCPDWKILETIVSHDNVRAGVEFFASKTGTPQGSALSPILFCLVTDRIISKLKQAFPSLEVICYADDFVLAGQVDVSVVIEIFASFGLKINPSKCCSFFGSFPDIPMANKTTYLGIELKRNGDLSGFAALEKLVKQTADDIGKCCFPPGKSWRLALAYIKPTIQYQRSATDQDPRYSKLWYICVKRAMKWPRSLPQVCVIELEKRFARSRTSGSFKTTLLRLLKLHDHIINGSVLKITPNIVWQDPREIEAIAHRGQISRSRYAQQREELRDRVVRPTATHNRQSAPEQAAQDTTAESRNTGLTGFCVLCCSDKSERHRYTEKVRARLERAKVKPTFRPNPRNGEVRYLIVHKDDLTNLELCRNLGKKALPSDFWEKLGNESEELDRLCIGS